MDRIIKAFEVNHVRYNIIRVVVTLEYGYDYEPEYNTKDWWVDSHEIYDFELTNDIGDKITIGDSLQLLDKVILDNIDIHADGYYNNMDFIMEAIQVEPNVWYVKEVLGLEVSFYE